MEFISCWIVVRTDSCRNYVCGVITHWCSFSGSIEKRQKHHSAAPHRKTRTIISLQNLGFGKVSHGNSFYLTLAPLWVIIRLLSMIYVRVKAKCGVCRVSCVPSLLSSIPSFYCLFYSPSLTLLYPVRGAWRNTMNSHSGRQTHFVAFWGKKHLGSINFVVIFVEN